VTPWASQRWLTWLLKDSAVYGGAAALNKGMALVTFPILTRAFSVDDYGAMDLFNVVANLAALAIVWGQDSAVVRQLADESDTSRRRDIVSTSLILQAAIAVVATGTLLLAATPTAKWFSTHADAPVLLSLVALQLPLLVVTANVQGLLRWTFRRNEYLMLTIVPTAVSAIGVWLLSRAGLLSLVGLFVFTLTVRLVAALLGLWMCRALVGWPGSAKYLAGLWKLAWPLGLVSALGATVPLMERMAVVRWVDERTLGIYAVGATVAGLLALPIMAMQTAWGPFSLAVHRQAGADAIFGTVARLATAVLCALCLLLAGIAEPTIRFLATERFVAAWGLVFPLGFALVVQAVGWILEVGLFFAKRNELTLVAYVVYLVGTLAAMALLAPLFGIVGIAWAVVLGQCLRTVVVVWLAHLVHPIRWPLGSLALMCAGTAAVFLAARAVPLPGPWTGAPMVVAAALLGFCAWRFAFTASERREIGSALRRDRNVAEPPAA
jgi:O-antigen/teichoic acid export membrane protein